MRRIFPLLASLALCSTVSARIGETPGQCAARYGEPEATDGRMSLFRRAGLVITVTFYGGIADSITFRKVERDTLDSPAKISDNEIQQLLAANGSGREWKPLSIISVDKTWQTSDGEILAQYETFKHDLLIATRGYIERYSAKKAADENANLKGF